MSSTAFSSPQLSSRNDALRNRADTWRLRSRSLALPPRPLVMGIVNVTPDSFSDGGKFLDPHKAVEHALQLVAEGADILDIGGESTRPYSQPVSPDLQLRRVMPVITALAGQTQVPISIDTSNSAVAQACVDAGAEIINDVTGLAGDHAMVEVARHMGAAVCVMHMQGTPQTMQDNPTYTDVVAEVFAYLNSRFGALVGAGLDPQRIALDPGVGFGKTHEHNLTLLAGCWRFHELGRPLLVGHSRKGYIGKVIGDSEADRDAGTIGVALALARQGVQILRVHDVRVVREALLLFEATGGL
jgi:dihydropteroate synthase